MNRHIKMKKILCLGMAFTIAAYTNVMATVAVPPISAGGQTQQQGIPGTNGTQFETMDQNSAQTANPAPAAQQGPGSQAPDQSAGQTGTGITAGQPQTAVSNVNLTKPVVQAQGAVLYDVTHNQYLFEQNAEARFYPASITKLMTALLVLEKTNLNDVVTFSSGAVTNLESGAVTLKVKAGDKISVRDCLYGLLLKSANEVANGLAEHVAGSVSAFCDLMNQKAASLGCTNTHFANPNGLNDVNHFTTAKDMALIAAAAFANPTLCQIDSTLNYNFPATAGVPGGSKLTMAHKMLNPANTEYYYQGVVGGKTGYTSLAGNTLVTCAERDGVRLIAVVLKSKQSHYQDTKAMLDYGFEYVKANSANYTNNAQTDVTGPGGQTQGNQTPGGQTQGNQAQGGQTQGNTVQNTGSWVQDTTGWRYIKADGTYAKNESLLIKNEYYCFNAEQYMVTGWYSINGGWYYFRPSGGMAANRWIETNGMWYYVGTNGALFTNGTTPDGFVVDANGVWTK